MTKQIIILLFIFLSACTKEVITDFNSAVDYSSYKTYEFAKFATTQATTLDGKRIEDAIRTELYTKGITNVTEKGDLLVRHFIEEHSDFQTYGTSLGLGYHHRNVGIAYSTPTPIREYRYGKIVIELIDPKTNLVIWRSASQRRLTDAMTPSSRKIFIESQINEIFKEFPPN
ncbi:DUF4136 domain-containing protein (plasmid) [Photobacterium sp. DA100]|uniref:DUF4136 domain-containing protein n=1 Tax=Photobacterium sp. DA100 TaxID=3027472 RepID=UPI00247AE95A|nr:DUF4136 domain-containing protein [Photobacterium sp. DA100]WEM45630.1 DUF4136 domain-containing protein [Photobacterium sp. DA100]